MIPPADSLLKYDNPVLVSRGSGAKSPKGRSFKVSPQQSPETTPVPPPPKPKPGPSELQNEEIINSILPPREWTEGTQLWVQKVSSAPCTRTDVVQLSEQLDIKLQQKQARLTGICRVRRELYSQCFDELIRQVTINCAERGLLLFRVREEIQMTLAAYQTIYESSMAFGMRKALQSEHGKADMEKKIAELENEKRDLIKQLNEQKAECDAIEKREAEKRQVEEKKHSEEIQFLKRANQQLKVTSTKKYLPAFNL
ncbi:hypothetical protein WMY93_026707 [Mugilogobius chulae]|uniref:Axonemal dynein light intermediate polypeptide 1 n=1 Tax=Mugilogobius chulae TaxID=88201 RepID=A0AAW0MYA1_9GOBI